MPEFKSFFLILFLVEIRCLYFGSRVRELSFLEVEENPYYHEVIIIPFCL